MWYNSTMGPPQTHGKRPNQGMVPGRDASRIGGNLHHYLKWKKIAWNFRLVYWYAPFSDGKKWQFWGDIFLQKGGWLKTAPRLSWTFTRCKNLWRFPVWSVGNFTSVRRKQTTTSFNFLISSTWSAGAPGHASDDWVRTTSVFFTVHGANSPAGIHRNGSEQDASQAYLMASHGRNWYFMSDPTVDWPNPPNQSHDKLS